MVTVKQIINQSIWEDFILSSNQVNFLQSWHWGLFYRNLGNKIIRLGFYKGANLIGVALLIKVTAKRGTYLECPGGPIIDWRNKKIVDQALKKIIKTGQQEKVSFIRIRPNILVGSFNPSLHGLIKAPMHLHAETTWVLNLEDSEEDLLKNMRKNTRYSIRQAKKLKVKVIESNKLTDIDLLYQLQLETVRRKKFIPFSKLFLKQQMKTYQNTNQIQLFKAKYKGQILAIAMIHFYGKEAVYHYSGSSSQLRNIPASYAIQWHVIKKAKALGFKRYNFWGYTDNPKHRFFGPSLFKKGFGGYKLEYLPAQDLPLKKSYWLTYSFETLRRKLRHL